MTCAPCCIRPLIGYDKQEIVNISERSVPLRPPSSHLKTAAPFCGEASGDKANVEVIRRSEERLSEKIDQLLKEAVESVEIIEVGE